MLASVSTAQVTGDQAIAMQLALCMHSSDPQRCYGDMAARPAKSSSLDPCCGFLTTSMQKRDHAEKGPRPVRSGCTPRAGQHSTATASAGGGSGHCQPDTAASSSRPPPPAAGALSWQQPWTVLPRRFAHHLRHAGTGTSVEECSHNVIVIWLVLRSCPRPWHALDAGQDSVRRSG